MGGRPERVAGVDEAGRGPLAGPVVAAAVILDPDRPVEGLTDSKKLTPGQRESLAEEIRQCAVSVSLGRAEVEEIDRINILQASLLAMRRAVMGLGERLHLALVDGIHAPDLPCRVETIVKGDESVEAISAASIIAKVARDAEMMELAEKYPGYGFESHKGYPTRQHIRSLDELGVCPIHRRSFGPVRKRL